VCNRRSHLAPGPALFSVSRIRSVRLNQQGDRARIDLDAAASQPVGEWEVSAFDLTGAQEREQYVDVALDTSTVSAGQTAR
jgi:hypothetical protein